MCCDVAIGRRTMTEKELKQMVQDEEKRLGVGSSDFMRRHREIMEQCNSFSPISGRKEAADEKAGIRCERPSGAPGRV